MSRRGVAMGVAGVALIAVLASGVCSGTTESSTEDPRATLPTGTLTIDTERGPAVLSVEIAETPESRARGLMYRQRLGRDAGMVFLFDGLTRGGFWMKDTLIPLSIAFWDQGGTIVDILDMEPCRSVLCPIYRPAREYVGAVEVNRGWFDDHGVGVGNQVTVSR